MTLVKFHPIDVRGNLIQDGCLVAYNLSGDVALGDVVYSKPSGPIRVRLRHPAAGHRAGHISRVKRWSSMLVLAPEDLA